MVLYQKRETSEGHIIFERVKSFKKEKIIHRCVTCGTILRTGKKYCYKHKKTSKKKEAKQKDKSLSKYFLN